MRLFNKDPKIPKGSFRFLPMGMEHQKTKSNTICEIKLLLLLSLKLTIYSYINFIVFLFHGFNVLTFSQIKEMPQRKKIKLIFLSPRRNESDRHNPRRSFIQVSASRILFYLWFHFNNKIL